MHVIELSTDLWNVETSLITLLKSYSVIDAPPAILLILEKLTGNICGGVSFQYSLGDRLNIYIYIYISIWTFFHVSLTIYRTVEEGGGHI